MHPHRITRLLALGLLFSQACTADRSRPGSLIPSDRDLAWPDLGQGAEDAAVELAFEVYDLTDSPRDLGQPDRGVECRLNSDCIPGTYCQEGYCRFDCREDRDCQPGEFCHHGNGKCTAGCLTDQNCAPPYEICEERQCVIGCLLRGCESDQTCDRATGRCVTDLPPDPCRVDSDCAPPALICEQGSCVDGCLRVGCEPDETCRAETGRCEPALPPRCAGDEDCDPLEECNRATGECEPRRVNLPDGEDCARAEQCHSGVCFALAVAGVPHQVCTHHCCSEWDCAAGLGCLFFFGVNLCLPSRIFPRGTEFTQAVGASCGLGGNSCRSGLCFQEQDRCLQGCCTDRDCGAAPCSWSPVGNTARAFCDGVALLGGIPGEFCSGMPFECQSGICLPDPADPRIGKCAAACCSDADCPSAEQACVQIAGPGGAITYGCAVVPRGAGAVGDPCAGPQDGGACASGICVEGKCSRTCCLEGDCPLGFTCQVAANGEGGYIRACIPPRL